jgi:amino acid adenylation domain-containing protein
MVRYIATLTDLLRQRALHQPSDLAFTFLADQGGKESSLTYGQLDFKARVIAARLQDCMASQEKALLLYPPGLDFIEGFFGCLYAGVIAVPVNRTLPRLQAVVSDAKPTVALTTTQILPRVRRLSAHVPELLALRWLATDTTPNDGKVEWKEAAAAGETVAFLQYTSGSTAAPKGVILTHTNLLHNASLVYHTLGHAPGDKYVSWLPTFHDMGFMAGVLQPLYAGIPAILISPLAFLQRPIKWLEAISRYKASTSGGPNFAYDLCVRKIGPEQCSSLDLSSWSVAFNGSEPIRAGTLERFAKAFEPCGFRLETFYPCYGLAESTLIVSGGRKADRPIVKSFDAKALENNRIIWPSDGPGNDRPLVSCGRALLDQEVIIAHPDSLTRCQPDEVGEIWVSGPSVARGYWGRLEDTQQTFNAHLADTGEGPFLRTGDLGFIHDKDLFITGRLKDLIIIRGLNYYPQDIELTVERSSEALRPGCGAAFSIELDGEERLVVIQEMEENQGLDPDALIWSIRKAVAESHELQLYAVGLVKPNSIPKTSSGKIQRRACRNAFIKGDLKLLAEWRAGMSSPADADVPISTFFIEDTEATKTWLAMQVAARAGVHFREIDTDLAIIGYALDSLMAIELAHSIERELGVSLSMTSVFQHLSIAELAAHIQARLATGSQTPKSNLAQTPGWADEIPLSFGQQALWFLHQLAPDSPAYNIVVALRVHTSLDLQSLRSAFQSLIDRHACLRTTFKSVNGAPTQRIHRRMKLCFEQEDASAFDDASLNRRLVESAYRPFDLEEGPLLRVGLLKLSADKHIMLLTAHHIVADFWSLALLVQELGTLYRASATNKEAALNTTAWQYGDYIRWQKQMLTGPEGERLWAYWQRQLSGELPALNLPLDKPRPLVQTYRGSAEPFKLNANVTARLMSLAHSRGATLYMTLLSVFQALLYRYTGQEEILVGCPTAGRTRAELADLVGYFVNPLALRVDFSDNPTFEVLLEYTRRTVVGALEHQDYPFVRLVEQLQPVRDTARSPLFQVMFVLQKSPLLNCPGLEAFALGEAGIKKDIGGFALESLALEQRVVQFDLTLMMAKVDGELLASLQYNTDLFEASSIARMVGHFQSLTENAAADPSQRISGISLLTQLERNQLISDWNRTCVDYQHHMCIHQLFEAQVERTPHARALVCDDEQLTYRELNRRANQLAYYLQSFGVDSEARVGVCLERSGDMIVSILAILKAGGAYVPLDPNYPKDRLAFMLEDARVKVLLSQPELLAEPPDRQVCAVTLTAHAQAIDGQREENPSNTVTTDNLAYIIYTSGSTGKPKGVAIEHRSTAMFLNWARNVFPANDLEGVLASTSICFDLSVFEIFAPLSWGGTIILAESPLHIINSSRANDVTLINTVPSAIAEMVGTDAIRASVRTINLAGEPLQSRLAQQIYERTGVSRILNLYGPSEYTTYATYAPVIMGDSTRPVVGRPVSNTQVYLLDRQQQPVPVGIQGEVYIGGDGLARGYLERPELTAEKFVPDPFIDVPGNRLYRTGDLARYLPKGDIDFLGRIDHQVKIRGFRIELGEIESALMRHPAVQQAVVIVHEEGDGDRRLVTYITIDRQRAVTTGELREFLKERLPGYMVPYSFVLLDQLPLTANGKVNRLALPAADKNTSDLERPFEPPGTPGELMLAKIWGEVLGTDSIGAHDNFFLLGGHSLLAVRILSRIRDLCHVDLPLRILFEEPTIRGLAEAIEFIKQKAPGAQAPPVTRASRQARRVTISPQGILVDSDITKEG